MPGGKKGEIISRRQSLPVMGDCLFSFIQCKKIDLCFLSLIQRKAELNLGRGVLVYDSTVYSDSTAAITWAAMYFDLNEFKIAIATFLKHLLGFSPTMFW